MISVIVPALNEADNIRPLIAEIVAAAAETPIREIIYIDDGSTDATLSILSGEMQRVPFLRVIYHDRPLGQSAAFLSGARSATQELLVFMDADLQNNPVDIKHLFARYQALEPANPNIAVLGQRAVRNDSGLRKASSRLANKLRTAVLDDQTRDTGCSLKLIRREDYLGLPYFDHMHRFLPSLLIRNGVKLSHVDVSHRSRIHGRSKYGFWNRALIGAVDLMGAAWLARRKLPLDYKPQEISKADIG